MLYEQFPAASSGSWPFAASPGLAAAFSSEPDAPHSLQQASDQLPHQRQHAISHAQEEVQSEAYSNVPAMLSALAAMGPGASLQEHQHSLSPIRTRQQTVSPGTSLQQLRHSMHPSHQHRGSSKASMQQQQPQLSLAYPQQQALSSGRTLQEHQQGLSPIRTQRQSFNSTGSTRSAHSQQILERLVQVTKSGSPAKLTQAQSSQLAEHLTSPAKAAGPTTRQLIYATLSGSHDSVNQVHQQKGTNTASSQLAVQATGSLRRPQHHAALFDSDSSSEDEYAAHLVSVSPSIAGVASPSWGQRRAVIAQLPTAAICEAGNHVCADDTCFRSLLQGCR